MEFLGLLSAPLAATVDLFLRRRRAEVLVHRGHFLDNSSPPVTGAPSPAGDGYPAADPVAEQLFVKIVNRSRVDLEVTHVWFATKPPVQLLNDGRRLPARLRPDETYETWVPAAALPPQPNLEKLARVRLSVGRTVKSRANKNVPPFGYAAGGGSA
ncbi:hypothetical protein AB0K15_31420 [Amycolatopsis sp. NPDC049253]|uniref:hypothetical protein n=1 Tax=Amycolatopsis sp. NPDC049253 TaxID=3155274 RepID=UPI003415343A